MSLVEVVCDVFLLVIFGAEPKLEIFGQSFGMKGPMQLFSGTLWKLGGSVDVLSLAFFQVNNPLWKNKGCVMMEFSVVGQDLKAMWLSEFPH